jgi:aspartate carbamoyltransferase catalytic subunit
MNTPQQVLLRDAMRRLNMTRAHFAERIGARQRALDAWLLPEESKEFRAMPEVARKYVTEILSTGSFNHEYTQSVYNQIPWQSNPSTPGRHLLSVTQFSRDGVESLFRLADVMQPIAKRRKITRVLEGAVLANLFFEASTRTRVSFGAAFCRLGGSVCDTTGFTFSSMAKGESIADTSRVVSGYADAIVVRHPEKGSVLEFAQATNIPIINGGDGAGEHPTQALLDLYTIQREFSRLGKLVDGSHVAMIGDLRNGRTVHSLMQLLSLYHGLKFSLISPPTLSMPNEIIEISSRNDHVVEIFNSPNQALAQADVIYATRIQRERMDGEEIEGLDQSYVINTAKIKAHCRPDVLIMHPLPRDSRPGAIDLSCDLDDDHRLAIFRQTDNGIPIRMAIFAAALGVDHLVQRSLRDATWWSPDSISPNDHDAYDIS